MIINESAVQTLLKTNNVLQFLKSKTYDEITLIDFITELLNKNKKTICHDMVFVDGFVSKKAVGCRITFASCFSYYSKLLNEGFEKPNKTISNFNPINKPMQQPQIITDNSIKVPDDLFGTKTSSLSEFFTSPIHKRTFKYVRFDLHYILNSTQIGIKKVNLQVL